MAGNKFPGTFTPALSQELFSPELNSGIIIPSYQREYECWLFRNNIPKEIRKIFSRKKIPQEFLARSKITAEDYSGIKYS